MNASYRWLSDFTAFDMSPRELRDMLTARVATVDEVVPLRQDLAGIIVGQVASARPHPDSDHLWLTRVDAGGAELVDVVCGAPNVQEGVKYAYAPVGTVLPGGLKLERRKIRGHVSNGMLCSARELELGADHAGILALDTDAAPGAPFLSAFPAGDTRLVIDVLPNRPDLLAHEGVAREISAFTEHALQSPLPQPLASYDTARTAVTPVANSGATAGVRVSVDGNAGCSLYIAVVIRNVRIGPSDEWLTSRLTAAGLRPINNVVDVTNYMLHGFGQPMHAFDLSRLAGPEIQVRLAHEGESIATLDGVTRKLQPFMTVIADARQAQAVAGVIGGEGSEVTDATTDVLLEVAAFDARAVRRTRRALGLSTDASYRFERGVDSARSEELARIATGLICAVSGGCVDAGPIIVGTPAPPHAEVLLRASRVAQLLGATVPAAECARLLSSIGFGVSYASDGSDASDATLRVQPPSWRPDVVTEVDLIEEIARLHGYNTLPDQLGPFRLGAAVDSPWYTLSRRVSRACVEAGLFEVRPIPFVRDAGERGVRVTNPLAESESMLRSSALQTLARRVEHNFARMSRNVRLYEIGIVFEQSDDVIPLERSVVAAVLTGDRYPAHFTDPRPPQLDLWDARNVAEEIVRAAFGSTDAVEFAPNAAADGWDLVAGDRSIGIVAPLALDAPVWASAVFGIELDLASALVENDAQRRYVSRRYVPLPSTPAAEFDLALLLPATVRAADVQRVIASSAGELLEALQPFDEFTGNGVPEGFRSVAWRLTLRHPERTLRDKEIEGRRAKIVRTLDEELGVRPRT